MNMRQWWKKERGVASVSLFILALPLIIGSFGLGFDAVRAIYLKGYIQNRVTLAVQNGLATNTSTDSSGNLVLSNQTLSSVWALYRDNTQAYRTQSVLLCDINILQSTPIAPGTCSGNVTIVGNPGTLADYCQKLSGGGVFRYGVRYQVKEKVETVFLRILGIKTLTLSTVTAEALLRPNCP